MRLTSKMFLFFILVSFVAEPSFSAGRCNIRDALRNMLTRVRARGPAADPLANATFDADTIARARAAYRETGRDIPVNPNGSSPETQLARNIDGQDFFGFGGQLNLDEAVRAGRISDNAAAYNGNRQYWWLDSNVPVARSKSPEIGRLAREYGDSNVRRTVGWPNRAVSNSGNTTDLATRRFAMNEAFTRGANGERVRTAGSLEVIAQDANGQWQPFLYEWKNGAWVQMRTLRGEPVRNACIRCHSTATNPTRFTPVPYRVVRDSNAMHEIYDNPYTSTSYNQFRQ